MRLLLALLAVTCLLSPAPAAASSRGALSPGTVAQRVARVYGERHPRLIHEEHTTTDSTPHQTMYVLGLSGRFHRGHLTARYLYFSALTRRWYVWGITAYDAQHHAVWFDAVLPHKVRE